MSPFVVKLGSVPLAVVMALLCSCEIDDRVVGVADRSSSAAPVPPATGGGGPSGQGRGGEVPTSLQPADPQPASPQPADPLGASPLDGGVGAGLPCPTGLHGCGDTCVPAATCCAACSDGLICRDGTCLTTCSADSDCIGDHFCNGGKCIGRVIQISAGSVTPTACSLHSDGVVRCWGYGGDGMFGGASGPGPVVVPLPMAARQIAVGNRTVCAAMSDASLWCWGDVMIEYEDNYTSPVPYPGLTNVASVALSLTVGGCVAHGNGTVSCWGLNSGGLLGRGTNDESFWPPAPVPGLSDVVQIERGQGHMCARLSTGAMMCWGDNYPGAVGIGSFDANTGYIDPRVVSAPTLVSGIVGAKQIASAALASFALLGDGASDGVLMGWGSEFSRGTGPAGSAISFTATPERVDGTTLFSTVSAGGGSGMTCGITMSGGVKCWGARTFNGEIFQDLSPVDIAGVQNATALGVGGGFACALVGPTQIMCWGDNGDGQLGNALPSSMAAAAVEW